MKMNKISLKLCCQLPETEVNAASVRASPKSTPKDAAMTETKGSETGVSKPLDTARQIEKIKIKMSGCFYSQ